jgi:hypothetical protein
MADFRNGGLDARAFLAEAFVVSRRRASVRQPVTAPHMKFSHAKDRRSGASDGKSFASTSRMRGA